jgi:hypothetical protein
LLVTVALRFRVPNLAAFLAVVAALVGFGFSTGNDARR